MLDGFRTLPQWLFDHPVFLALWVAGMVAMGVGIYLIARRRIGPPCEWFMRCDRPATHLEHHPILGDVPACDRCPQIGRS